MTLTENGHHDIFISAETSKRYPARNAGRQLAEAFEGRMIGMEKKDVLAALAALSQETRLDIFRLLVQAGPEGRSAGAIAEALGVAPATLSFHLSNLTHAGLIVQRRESRSLIYSADYDCMNAVLGYLSENCCGRPANAAVRAPVCTPTTKAANTENQGDTSHEAATCPRRGC
jgi:ArsR family transcriptional regulator